MGEYLEVEGGFPVSGELKVSGAKNAVLPALSATILAPGLYRFKNYPRLSDLYTMLEVLEHLGAEWEERKDELLLDTTKLEGGEAPYTLVSKMRASILVLGPLVARFGRAKVAMPGGCQIGKRPVDLHLEGLKRLGCSIRLEHGYIVAEAKKSLKGAEVVFDFPSVTATENLLMAAALCRGKTTIVNAAREPEVVFLGEMLRLMGVKVNGLGTEKVEVVGSEEAHPPRVPVRIIPDRIETGTFMMIPAMVGGEVTLTDTEPSFLETPILKLREAGLEVEVEEDRIFVRKRKRLRGIKVSTAPYPGFPTDLQAQIMAMATAAKGTSYITENLFEERFQHVFELKRMGADIELVDGRTAVVRGPVKLQGAEVQAHDLRAGASLVIAALAAEGTSKIYGLEHLDRGYERIEEKLRKLGARIERRHEPGKTRRTRRTRTRDKAV